MKFHTHPLLQGVAPSLLNQCQPKIKQYHKGATLHPQGAHCDHLDLVLEGALVAYRLAPNGSETSVFGFRAGDSVGANLLFGTQNAYPMNIYCTQGATIASFTKREVECLLADATFVMRFVTIISSNAQGMNQKMAMYTQKSLRENILEYLCALVLEQRSKTIVLPISKKELADYFGVQRPSLFRELKRLKEEGILLIDNKTITLVDNLDPCG
ncbi:MAG: Crp/Fnr family transcriptional regulator [Erysipelotrichaceae bacterium]